MTAQCGRAGTGGRGRMRAWGSKAAVIVGHTGSAVRTGEGGQAIGRVPYQHG
jgi:hypothetical protein